MPTLIAKENKMNKPKHIIEVIALLLLICNCVKSQDTIVNGIPRDTTFTVANTFAKEVKKRPYIKIVKSELPKGVKVIEDISYSEIKNTKDGDRKLYLNIYRPNDNTRYPALLMIHGGGWSSGDMTMEIPIAQKIASEGYVTIPVEYRLSPEAIYPAAIYDVKNAIRWIKLNADKYGIDTTKIAISGCSSGGQIATLVGVTPDVVEYNNHQGDQSVSDKVQAVINIDGVSTFLENEAILSTEKYIKTGKKQSAIKWFDGTVDEKKADWTDASPLYRVSENAVPICFINSSIPRFHDGRDEMIEKLTSYDIYTEVQELPDTPHTFWLFEPWFNTTSQYMIAFLNRMFK